MDAKQFAQDIYDAQQVTVDEYPSVEAYVNDLMDWLKEEGWDEDVDLEAVRRHLTRMASSD